MREYIISRANAPIDWSEIPKLNIDHQLWLETTVDIPAFGQICYSDDAFYVRLCAKEQHIRSEETGPLGMPYNDSCLEFFFCPVPGDSRYFNIEYNPDCCVYLGLGTGVPDQVRLLPLFECFDPVAKRTEDGWEVQYRVPFSFIRRFFPEFAIRSGMEIRANCFKCGNLTPQPHYLAWNPVLCQEMNFHRPEYFGVMRFE